MALLPPLLLHFTLVFPERPPGASPARSGACWLPLMYVPALLLGAARVVGDRARIGSDGPLFSRALDMLDRAEPVYLFLCAAAALVVLVRLPARSRR